MKLFAPKYYTEFACIADRCRHSCCVGWEIDVDMDAAARYASFDEGYGACVRDSLCLEDTPHFRLCEQDRCPHLDERGLCRIISELGEEELCEICREHPRFYQITAQGREAGLGMACEEACRIILSSDDYSHMILLDEDEEGPDIPEFDVLPYREELFCMLADPSLSYEEKLCRIEERFCVSPACHSDEYWKEVLAELEYLDSTHKTLFSCYTSTPKRAEDCAKISERFLAYFLYRHLTKAYDLTSLRAHLGFCLLCERLLASLMEKETASDNEDAARILSEELEYSEENTDALTWEFLALLS